MATLDTVEFPLERGWAVVPICVSCERGDRVTHPAFKFKFDSGSRICLIPLVMARHYGIHVEVVEENQQKEPPHTKNGKLRGCWGTVHISLLGLFLDLECFFYELEEHELKDYPAAADLAKKYEDAYRLNTDPTLDDLMKELWREDRAEKTELWFPMPLLGLGGFIDEFEITINRDRIAISRVNASEVNAGETESDGTKPIGVLSWLRRLLSFFLD